MNPIGLKRPAAVARAVHLVSAPAKRVRFDVAGRLLLAERWAGSGAATETSFGCWPRTQDSIAPHALWYSYFFDRSTEAPD